MMENDYQSKMRSMAIWYCVRAEKDFIGPKKISSQIKKRPREGPFLKEA